MGRSMKIEVRSVKLLWLYRSFLFRKTKFYTNNNELNEIVNGLNIKNRVKRIEYIYDRAVEYINEYYSDDLCQFVDNKCIVQRMTGSSNVNGCCRKCRLLSSKGCFSCNLACKLIYCKTAIGNIKLLSIWKIPVLKCLSIGQRLILRGNFYNTKEEIIKDLNYGLGYWVIKEFWKDIVKNKYRVKG